MLVRVINISDEECKIGCDAELGTACEASLTLDLSSTSSDGDCVEEPIVDTTMEIGDTIGEELPFVRDQGIAASVPSSALRWMSIRTQPDTSHVECMFGNLQSNLSEEQKQSVREFVNTNVDVFSASEFDLGRTTLVEHRIDLTENKPVHQALRRHPVAYLPAIDKYVDDLVKHKIVQPRPGSEWVANIVLVRKKDGTL